MPALGAALAWAAASSALLFGACPSAELRLATDKLAAVRAAVTDGDTDRTRRRFEQVAIDARVAELHADAMRSARVARQTQDAALALSEEIQRINLGVPAEQLSTPSLGEAQPVAPNNTWAGGQMNRRVEDVLAREAGDLVQK